jgi:hypothetical protein
MKKTIIIVLVVALISGIGVAYYQFTKTYADTEDLKPEESISATELYLEFSNDEASAIQKYGGKIIEVSGEISSIIKGNEGELNIFLKAEGQVFAVACNMQNNTTDQSLEKGKQVTIRGECSGFLSDVILIRCIIKNQ